MTRNFIWDFISDERVISNGCTKSFLRTVEERGEGRHQRCACRGSLLLEVGKSHQKNKQTQRITQTFLLVGKPKKWHKNCHTFVTARDRRQAGIILTFWLWWLPSLERIQVNHESIYDNQLVTITLHLTLLQQKEKCLSLAEPAVSDEISGHWKCVKAYWP